MKKLILALLPLLIVSLSGCSLTKQKEEKPLIEKPTENRQAEKQASSSECDLSAGSVWCESRQECIQAASEACDSGIDEINFERSGVGQKNAPGLVPDQLYLLYEEPGSPALSVQLVFDEKSYCGDQERKIICMALSVSDFGVGNGRKIKIKGVRDQDKVKVRELEYLNDK